MKKQSKEGYIYILQEREFLEAKKNIYKIGKTTQMNCRRLCNYPKGSKLFMCKYVNDCDKCEKDIKIIFNKKFQLQSNIGNESFKGDINEMEKCLWESTCKYDIVDNATIDIKIVNTTKVDNIYTKTLDIARTKNQKRMTRDQLYDIYNTIAKDKVTKKIFGNEMKNYTEYNTHHGYLILNNTINKNELLYNACDTNNLKVVEQLLSDPEVNPAFNNNACFVYSCNKNHIEIVKLLLKHDRVNPSARDNSGIRWACEKGYTELVELLLKDTRIDPSTMKNYAIINASIAGYTKIVELLLQDKRVNPADRDNDSIIDACDKGHTEIIKLLLKDKRVDPSARNNSCIKNASKHGYLGIVIELLKDKRVDPSIDNNYSIKEAQNNKHTEVVKVLLKDERVSNVIINNLNK